MVERLGPTRFRLQESPLSATTPVYAGDLIEVEPRSDGSYRFARIVDAAPMRHHSWVVPWGWFESADAHAFMSSVEACGGTWEQSLGGLLHVHIPRAASFDAEVELDRYLKNDWPDA